MVLQFSKIEAFKQKLGKKALYWEFSNWDGFERDFRNHLAMVMQDLRSLANEAAHSGTGITRRLTSIRRPNAKRPAEADPVPYLLDAAHCAGALAIAR